MDATAFALVALICTQDNLVCRDATGGTRTYETVERCRDGLERISMPVPGDGYKIVARCIKVDTGENRSPEPAWALNWTGEPMAYVQQAAVLTAESGVEPEPAMKTQTMSGFDTAAASATATGRIETTLNAHASLN